MKKKLIIKMIKANKKDILNDTWYEGIITNNMKVKFPSYIDKFTITDKFVENNPKVKSLSLGTNYSKRNKNIILDLARVSKLKYLKSIKLYSTRNSVKYILILPKCKTSITRLEFYNVADMDYNELFYSTIKSITLNSCIIQIDNLYFDRIYISGCFFEGTIVNISNLSITNLLPGSKITVYGDNLTSISVHGIYDQPPVLLETAPILDELNPTNIRLGNGIFGIKSISDSISDTLDDRFTNCEEVLITKPGFKLSKPCSLTFNYDLYNKFGDELVDYLFQNIDIIKSVKIELSPIFREPIDYKIDLLSYMVKLNILYLGYNMIPTIHCIFTHAPSTDINFDIRHGSISQSEYEGVEELLQNLPLRKSFKKSAN